MRFRKRVKAIFFDFHLNYGMTGYAISDSEGNGVGSGRNGQAQA